MADRHRRQGQRRRRRSGPADRRARSATSSRRTRCTHNFTYASVKNKSGSFVAPSLASTSAAGEGVTIPANLGIKVINSPNATAYPITSQTFIVVNKDLCKAGIPGGEAAAKGVVQFLNYGARPGPVDPLAGRLRRTAEPRSSPSPRKRSRACSATAQRSAADERVRAALIGVDRVRWRQQSIPSGERSAPRALAARAPARQGAELRPDGAGRTDPGADRLLLLPPGRRSAPRRSKRKASSASRSATTGTSAPNTSARCRCWSAR